MLSTLGYNSTGVTGIVGFREGLRLTSFRVGATIMSLVSGRTLRGGR